MMFFQTNGLNGYVPECSNVPKHRPSQHFDPASQTFEVPKSHKLHYETPPRHMEARHYEAPQTSHLDGGSLRYFDSSSHHFDAAPRQHFDHQARHKDNIPAPRAFDHTARHFEPPSHHFEHPSHLLHEKHTKHVTPQNYAAAIEGNKNKLKSAYNNDDWQLLGKSTCQIKFTQY